MEALVNVDSSLICARIIQVFVGAFFYIFMIAKAVGSENKAKWFKRRMKYTFFNKRGMFSYTPIIKESIYGRNES